MIIRKNKCVEVGNVPLGLLKRDPDKDRIWPRERLLAECAVGQDCGTKAGIQSRGDLWNDESEAVIVVHNSACRCNSAAAQIQVRKLRDQRLVTSSPTID